MIELIDAASGEMLAFADQDDVWERDKISRLVGGIGSAAMAFGRSEVIDMAGARQGHTVLDLLSVTPGGRDRLEAIFHPMVSAHAAVMRRDAMNVASLINGMHPFDCFYDWKRRELLFTRSGLHPGNLRRRLAMPFSMRQAAGDAVRPPRIFETWLGA